MDEKRGASSLRNWPPQLRYLPRNEWALSIPANIRSFYVPLKWPIATVGTQVPAITHTTFPLKELSQNSQGPRKSLILIKKINDPNHPGYTQHGLFATVNLAPHMHVLDYIGQVHLAATASTTSDYILSFDRVTGLSVDAAQAGNEGRFINDFRGVAAKPNVEFETYRDAKTGEVKMGVWVGGKEIRKGEELCVSYGKGFWKERGLI